MSTLKFMEQWGNARANALYEAKIPAHINRPKEGDSVRVIEKFIRDKYEHKRYIADQIPPPNNPTASAPTETALPPSRRAQRITNRPSAGNYPAADARQADPSALTAPATIASPAQATAPAASTPTAPSLIDFSDDFVVSEVTPAPSSTFSTSSQFTYQQPPANQFDPFCAE